jgi:accessory Sec system S-layer assembly protein
MGGFIVMLSFLKRKNKKIEKLGSDSVVHSKELLGENGAEVEKDNEEQVTTTLSFHPKMEVSQEDRYYFQFLHNELPKLKPNQLALAGVELKKEGDYWIVVAFVRNSLSKGIQLSNTVLSLMGPQGEKFASKVFNLGELGGLPPKTSRPWQFAFHTSELNVDTLPKEGWILAFELAPKHVLDLDSTWEQHLSQEDKDRLASHVDSLEAPKPGEVNLAGITGRVAEDGNMAITLFIRNGNHVDIHIEQLPLFIEDASGEVVAKGVFALQDFYVKANTSKPWTFIFPKEMLLKEDIDLSRWRAYPPTAVQK